jgi:hypothetical protein
MKILACLLLAIVFQTGELKAQEVPATSSPAQPASAEVLVIYRNFLKTYIKGTRSALNVARTTIPFKPDDSNREDCLTAFSDDDLKVTSSHSFTPDAFPGAAVKLVAPRHDTSGGFTPDTFTFSDIVYDASHTHAAFSYAYICGGLCGNGSTVVYVRAGGVWKPAATQCPSWIK